MQALRGLAPDLLAAPGDASAAEPWDIAVAIFEAALRPFCPEPSEAPELLVALGPAVDELLAAVEAQAGVPGMARRARLHLERMTLEQGLPIASLGLGLTHVEHIELTEPIADIRPAAQAERIWCIVAIEGAPLGRVELPVCDGLVPGAVIADAIANAYAWAILGRFFERTLYPRLSIERHEAGITVRRGKLALAKQLQIAGDHIWPAVHDAIGWTALMQELYGRPDWPDAHFYDRKSGDSAAAVRRPRGGWALVEVSGDPVELAAGEQATDVVLAVGGVPVGSVRVAGGPGACRAQELRVRLIEASGMELCVAAVREALIGRPLDAEPSGLRARLAAQAARTPADAHANLAPASAAAVARALATAPRGLVIGQPAGAPLGSRAPRRAALPVTALSTLAEAAALYGSPVVAPDVAAGQLGRVILAPDVIGPARQAARAAANNAPAAAPSKAKAYDRNHFETLFAAHPDPWKYTSPYEQIKYEQTLAMIPAGRAGRALEIASAEGHFTAQLAPRVEHLVATDISQVALERTAARCADHSHIEYQQLDLAKDALPGRFDLIVCSEVLYYVGGRAGLRQTARKIAEALTPSGHLVTAHMNLVVDEPDRPGYDWDLPFGAKTIGETFAGTGMLELVRELHTPLYRVQLFRRRHGLRLPWRGAQPQIVKIEQPSPPPAQVADHVLWSGGKPRGAEQQEITTRHLPILMYHRVAPAGAEAAARYRVSPERFEEQLRYLRDSGFYSVRLEEWRAAMERRRPLPGRAALITFDDGYQDFQDYAWPLLKRYGFTAHVFLVADHIGGTNVWDQKFGETVPLLGWPAIRELQHEGVAFGAHTCSHRLLNSLAPAAVVEEGLRARMILERELGQPVASIAYPYGDADGAVQHLMGACGYTSGLTCVPGRAQLHESPLALPRLDVSGTGGLTEFIAQLGR
jgi:peptidoglycan/xylan/chitin deacetylase (PgdA/CDA1 family)/2-polyprenyl-3-methyl-5-hydroxy-6-metoxy-1,4-benzoquinol methylase